MDKVFKQLIDEISVEYKLSAVEQETLSLALAESELSLEEIAGKLNRKLVTIQKRMATIYSKVGIAGDSLGKLETLRNKFSDRIQLAKSASEATGNSYLGIDGSPSETALVESLQVIPTVGDKLYGRERDLLRLQELLIPGSPALVCVHGLGGFGKTALVSKFVQEEANKFDQVIWISLRLEQSCAEVLNVILKNFPVQGGTRTPSVSLNTLDQCIQLFQKLACLVVLEDFHRVLPRFRQVEQTVLEKWQFYERLLEKLNTSVHQSSIVVVSREQPRFFAEEDGSSRVHSLDVRGLNESAIEQFLLDRQVLGSVHIERSTLEKLHYQSLGHPLVLKVCFSRIRILFGGDVRAFLQEGSLVYGGLTSIVAEELIDLAPLEKEILYWLLINLDPVSRRTSINFEMLKRDILSSSYKNDAKEIEDALDSLIRRSLVDSQRGNFTLHELIEKPVRECLIKDMATELLEKGKDLYFLRRCALVKAKSNDSIRRRQDQDVVKPIAQCLINKLKEHELLKSLFNQLVRQVKAASVLEEDYLVSNIVQLCRSLEMDLTGFDFSGLSIRQANFRDLELFDVSFAGSNVSDSVFNNIFGGVLCVRCSPNGKLLASSDTDGSISIWSYANRDLIQKINAHTGWIPQIRFSSDGKFLVSVGEDEYCCVWSIETNEEVSRIKAPTRLLSLDLSPNGKTIAAAGEGGEVFLWDAESGVLIDTLSGHTGIVWSCAFSPNSKSLVSAGTDKTVREWNLENNSDRILIKEHSGHCRSLVYSPDGKYLARVSEGKFVRVWNIELGRDVAELIGSSEEVWTITFGRDPNELISAGTGGQICVWNFQQQEIDRTFQGHDATIYSVTCHPEEAEFLSGSSDQSICFWSYFESDIKRQKLDTLRGFSAGVRSICSVVVQDQITLISGGSDQRIYCWPLPTDISSSTVGELAVVEPVMFEKIHKGFIWSVATHFRSNLIASAGDDSEINLWNSVSREKIHTFKGHSGNVFSVSFDQSGRRLVSGSLDETIRIWNFSPSDSSIITIREAHQGGVRHVKFTPDETMLVSCGNDLTIKLWDVSKLRDTDEQYPIKVLLGHKSFVQFFDISFDGMRLVTCGDDKTIRLWNLTPEIAGEISAVDVLQGIHTAWIRGVFFSPNGQFFASCGEDGLVCLWSSERKEVIWCNRHEDNVGAKTVIFTPDGKFLVSGFNDGTIRVWNLDSILSSQTLNPIAILRTVQPYKNLNISSSDMPCEQHQILRSLGAVESFLPLSFISEET